MGEFQILACIPLTGSVPIKDIAELSGIPIAQLTRIVRFAAATAAFLDEPEDGQVAHTELSARFVSDPSYLDAAMFLAETMKTAPYSYGEVTGEAEACHLTAEDLQRPKVRREMAAYLRYVGGILGAEDVNEVLAQLHWVTCTARRVRLHALSRYVGGVPRSRDRHWGGCTPRHVTMGAHVHHCMYTSYCTMADSR